MSKNKCYVIAEAGVNHNGSVEIAEKLIKVASQSGADAVKFQTFKADHLVKPKTETAEYQRRQTREVDQLRMLRKLELSVADHERLLQFASESGIEFLSTAFDEESLDFLVASGMQRIKIPSGEITNLPLVRYVAEKNLPIILSTGMANLREVEAAIQVMGGPKKGTTLLHCTSSYPTAMEDVNLRAMTTLRDHFGLPVGYSDHTAGILIPPVAVALGATVIEKHFTLDRGMDGPDHHMSLEPEELAQMIRDIRRVEICLGDGRKEPRETELAVRNLVRRSVTLKQPVKRGEVVRRENLAILRPGGGIAPGDFDDVAGRKAVRDLDAWTTLQWSDLA